MVSSPDFILPLIHIDNVDNPFHAQIYFMREQDDKFLYIQVADWKLTELSDAIRFLSFLYAFKQLDSGGGNDKLGEAWTRCMALQSDSGDRLVNINAHMFNFKVPKTLAERGLDLFSIYDDPGGIFTFPLDHTAIVVKKVRGLSQEHRILERIRRLKANGVAFAEFIAPLIGFFTLHGIYIVLPSLRPITEIYDHPDIALRLSFELAAGVQFLHSNHIAHLDIKPDNLTLTSSWMLQIIDFGASIFVTNEEEEVSGRCSTEGYMAPEMVNSSLFNPIKVDRYSCGCVFLFFAQFNSNCQLLHFASELMREQPSERPPLHHWLKQTFI
ncbi:hypothetical protein GYMLUDRAFT_61397 [Collybiopsis luxurians FD-317 M1]|uniref:non-specific serine/threonine protein kinase n=1 Tax=Collybiopsis luxurians FD-317 M1 TaxID=944289 RepID=A0A0D0BQK2_9AGAR|nr:hypothetical protein GYMLUDRAFT_61397 [Collybiopsis luxurians FD-317 M1]